MVRSAALLSLAAIALLAGCSGAPGSDPAEPVDPGSEPASTPEANGDQDTACLIDKIWQLDVQDLASQLGEQLASGGIEVISTSAEGAQSITFDQEGYAGTDTNMTFTVVANAGEGLTMTMKQTHVGDPGGEWAWLGDAEGSVLTFDNWEADRYTVTTEVSINGTAAPSNTVPSGAMTGDNMTVECSGDRLTTQADPSPFIQHWVAEG